MDTPNNTSLSLDSLEGERQALRYWAQENHALLEVFLDAYVIVDRTNTVIDFNVAFTELCGESYRKILKTGDFCTLIKTEHCPDKCPARQTIHNNKPTRLDEIRGSSKAFERLQLIIGGIPIHHPSGKLLGALLTVRNVSAENELQKKYDERKEESVLDGLTRLYNKVYTELMLGKMIKGALREGYPLSIIMSDIDHFKKVNDTFGHQAGDHVLAKVAGILKTSARDSDIVGRFGGEEFTAILFSTDQTGTNIFAERFRKSVEATQIEFQGKKIPVTVSLGTATFQQKWYPGLDVDQCVSELVGRADAALYFAKANGRNQTCQSENLPLKSVASTTKSKKAG